MENDPIALYFVPANEGDHVIGIPARNLTESEVAEIRLREPVAFANATTPHPATGHVLYRKPTPPNLWAMKRAELEALAAEQGIANPKAYRNTTLLIEAIERGPDPAEAAEDAAEEFAPDQPDDAAEAPVEADAEDAPPDDESEQ